MIAVFHPLRVLLSIAIVLTFAHSSEAQTSGTLTTQTAQNWTTAPWNITSGAGTFPDGGGFATWNTHINTTIGTLAVGATVTLNQPITLGGITYNSPFSMTLAGSATNTLTLASSGGLFDVPLSIGNTLSLYQLANSITAPIAGGGTSGLTKTGPGTMTLGGAAGTVASTYTGGTHINGGILVGSAPAAVGDAVFGATGSGNGISMNGGAYLNNITGGWTTSRDIFLDTNGGSILPVTAATINGVISGPGNLNFPAFTAAVTLSGANTYTGATVKRTLGGVITLNGNGVINQSSLYDVTGTISLDNSGTNLNNRINASAPITTHQMTMALTGNAGAATNQTIGNVTLVNGINTFTVTPNASQQAAITIASITRQNQSTLFVRGTNLGAAPGAGVAQIVSTASPGTLIGGGGSAGSTNISILPWAVGNVGAAATLNSSFVTRNSVDGTFRPLAASEFAPLTSGATTDSNTSVAAATAIAAPTTVNSVLVTGTGTLLTGTGGLTITSGALLYSPASTTAGTISANINFGTAEGVITSTAGTANSFTPGLTLSGVISGSGGLTVNPIIGSSVTISGANTYTGTTTILGFTNFSGTVSNDGTTPSPFGTSTSAIVINSANGITGLAATAAATVNRNLSVIGMTGASGGQLLTSGAFSFTVNGDINLQTSLTMQGATGTFVINGAVSGPGFLSDLSTPVIQLNGNNTYSGGTNIQQGTYAAGSDTAFGTGTIFFSNSTTPTGAIRSTDTTARTIANNIFLGTNANFSGTGALNFTGGLNLNGSRTLTFTNTQPTAFAGVVSNGALTKAGVGIMNLSSPTGNVYTGGTVVSAGTLLVNNTSGSGTGSGTVSVASGATLGGSGSISGAIQINSGGTIKPGNSPGVLTVGSNLTLASGSNANFQIQGVAPGNGAGFHSQIIANGSGSAINITGSNLILDFTGATYTPSASDNIVLIDYSAGPAVLTGTFSSLPDGSIAASDVLGSGINYFIYYGTLAGFSNRVVLSAVPEPMHVLLVGAAGALGYRWVRRRQLKKS